jgi:hypothetical protein
MFTCFPRSPTEIRLRVYQLALPRRFVELAWNSKAQSIISKTPPPAILRTCHEPRRYGIEFYTELRFGDCFQVILVDFERDVVYFGAGCKHLVQSGSGPGARVKQNPKVIRDILDTKILRQNVSIAVFDCVFILAMEYSDRNKTMLEICGSMEKLHDVIIGKTNTEDEEVADSTEMTWACVPSTREEESHRILAAYKRSLEVRRMFNLRLGTVQRRRSLE